MIRPPSIPSEASAPTCGTGLALLLALFLGVGCVGTPKNKTSQSALPEMLPLPEQQETELSQRVEALARYATGVHYELNDQTREATAQFSQAARADLGNEDLVLDAARRLVRDQMNEEAIRLLQEGIDQTNAPGSYFAWLGLAYIQKGQTNEAVAANEQAITRSPDNLAAYQNLAALHLQAGRTNEALTTLERAYGRTNAPPEYLLGLVDLLARHQRQKVVAEEETRAKTLVLLGAAASQKPQNPLIIQRIADLYIVHAELAKAEPLYAELLQRYPGIPGLRERLANLYIRMDRNPEAAKLLEEIRQENPTEPSTYYFLGSLAYEAKQFDKAAEHYETALRLKPDFEPIYYDLAGVHIARRQPAEALDLLDRARGKFKLNFTLEFYTGLALSMMEKWADALPRMTSAELIAKTAEPNRLNHLFYFQLGSTYERAGQIPEAVTALKKSLELSPEFPDALNYLGYMWAERGENLEEARSMIEKAVQAEPDNEAYLDSLAWVHFKLKNLTEALQYMNRAIALAEKPDPTLLDHLGDIHAELRNFDLARDAYTRSLAIKPDEKIKNKLDLLTPR